jgi:hypothetical protein
MEPDNSRRGGYLIWLAEDIGGIVKRMVIDYLLNQPANPQTGGNSNTGKNRFKMAALYSHGRGKYATDIQRRVICRSFASRCELHFLPHTRYNSLGKNGERPLVWNGLPLPLSPYHQLRQLAPMVFVTDSTRIAIGFHPSPSPMAQSSSDSRLRPQAGDMTTDPRL